MRKHDTYISLTQIYAKQERLHYYILKATITYAVHGHYLQLLNENRTLEKVSRS